jgi:hypothetical protein
MYNAIPYALVNQISLHCCFFILRQSLLKLSKYNSYRRFFLKIERIRAVTNGLLDQQFLTIECFEMTKSFFLHKIKLSIQPSFSGDVV